MHRARTFTAPALAVFAALALSPAPAAAAFEKIIRVNCAEGQTIQSAVQELSKRNSGQIRVQGTCTENVVIETDGITLMAARKFGTTAVIAAADATLPTITIHGRRTTVSGFDSISGGSTGILVERNAAAEILGNTIENTVGDPVKRIGNGIQVRQSSFAWIENNTVRNAARQGVLVSGSSSATLHGNTVVNSGRNGIVAYDGASVSADSNHVADNGWDWLFGKGMYVGASANLFLSLDTGNPNTVINNRFGGITCGLNGRVEIYAAQTSTGNGDGTSNLPAAECSGIYY